MCDPQHWVVTDGYGRVVLDTLNCDCRHGPDDQRRHAQIAAAAPVMLAAAQEIDRLLLVIESAVRNSDAVEYAAILKALKANRAAIAKAEGRP